jgi:pimeloyl-ACP methyl ester carboxylesterase
VCPRDDAEDREADVDRLTQLATADDARVLMFAEYGPSDGFPVLTFHGTPQCRLRVERTVGVATDLGIRLISYDRPGCGGSDRSVAPAAPSPKCRSGTRHNYRHAGW